MRHKPGGILIDGLAGVGKTTLASAFVRWLSDTGGLGKGCFWFSFNDIHSATHVFNEMGRSLYGPQFGLGDIDTSIELFAKVFSEHGFVIVWDSFESVCGTPSGFWHPALKISRNATSD